MPKNPDASGSALTGNSITLIPVEDYKPIMKTAMDRLAALPDVDPTIVTMLFSSDELDWLRTQY